MPEGKYVNAHGAGAWLIVTPQVGATTIIGLALTSADDCPARDPRSFAIFGRTDDSGDFTQIASGSVPPFEGRGVLQQFRFSNTVAYTQYKVVFPAVAEPAEAGMVQIAQLQLFATDDPQDSRSDISGSTGHSQAHDDAFAPVVPGDVPLSKDSQDPSSAASSSPAAPPVRADVTVTAWGMTRGDAVPHFSRTHATTLHRIPPGRPHALQLHDAAVRLPLGTAPALGDTVRALTLCLWVRQPLANAGRFTVRLGSASGDHFVFGAAEARGRREYTATWRIGAAVWTSCWVSGPHEARLPAAQDWAHFAVSCRGPRCVLYVNGRGLVRPDTEHPDDTAFPGARLSRAAVLELTGTAQAAGLAVWGAAKTAPDVARVYVHGALALGAADLVGYWPMCEGRGRKVLDVSGHGRHAELRGPARWALGAPAAPAAGQAPAGGGGAGLPGALEHVSVLTDGEELVVMGWEAEEEPGMTVTRYSLRTGLLIDEEVVCYLVCHQICCQKAVCFGGGAGDAPLAPLPPPPPLSVVGLRHQTGASEVEARPGLMSGGWFGRGT